MDRIPPFYIGQRVIAVDALPGSTIINGRDYIIDECHYSPSSNPIANGASFWYVGVSGHHKWLRPSIFAPSVEPFRAISLSEVLEIETKLITNN